jgi:hypothetical protein
MALPIFLVAAAAAGVGAWIGSLSGVATANVTSPAAPPALPVGSIILYGAGAIALVWGAKKVMRM